ncbi:MAG: hypothetical protein WA194_03545 [Patescibacteria group bacterium]
MADGSPAALFLEGVSGGVISPDGKNYLYRRSGDDALYRKAVSGGTEHTLVADTRSSDEICPDTMMSCHRFSYEISPDGKKFFYTNRNDGFKVYVK